MESAINFDHNCISAACDDKTVDVRAHLGYLTHVDDSDNDQNRLTWCLGVDLLVVANSDGEEVHPLHQACLRLAKQTSESYAVGWAGALAVIEAHWKLAGSALGNATPSERGIRAYRDLSDTISDPSQSQAGYARDQLKDREDEEYEDDQKTLCSDSGELADTEQ